MKKFITPFILFIIIMSGAFLFFKTFFPDHQLAFFTEYKFTTQCHGLKLIQENSKQCFGVIEFFYE